MRVCMGWHVFQEEIHEGLRGLACILGGVERKFMRVCMGWHAF